jgi:hypothetical protein
MKRGVLYLVIAIPATAVIMGIITLVVAFSNADPGVARDAPEMSRTSWRDDS